MPVNETPHEKFLRTPLTEMYLYDYINKTYIKLWRETIKLQICIYSLQNAC